MHIEQFYSWHIEQFYSWLNNSGISFEKSTASQMLPL
jgi:hypothetical protein